jgi:hypothetical protein
MKYLPILLVLTGCSTLPKVPEKVLVPVSVPCIKELPARPLFATKDYLKSLSNPDYVTAITSEYLMQGNYINILESALIACKGN